MNMRELAAAAFAILCALVAPARADIVGYDSMKQIFLGNAKDIRAFSTEQAYHNVILDNIDGKWIMLEGDRQVDMRNAPHDCIDRPVEIKRTSEYSFTITRGTGDRQLTLNFVNTGGSRFVEYTDTEQLFHFFRFDQKDQTQPGTLKLVALRQANGIVFIWRASELLVIQSEGGYPMFYGRCT